MSAALRSRLRALETNTASIEAAEIATAAVTTAKLDDEAVTAAKIADGTITAAKLYVTDGWDALPTSDPGVDGAIFLDTGVVTVSLGN